MVDGQEFNWRVSLVSSGVLFRTHYGGGIGHGHIMRCLSIASILQEKGFDSVFLLDQKVEDELLDLEKYKCYFLNEFNSREYFEDKKEMGEEDKIIECMKSHNLKILFFDKYLISNELLKNLKDKGCFIAGFDDFGHRNYFYDLLIDHNYINKNQDRESRVLGGLEHCVLDGKFKHSKDTRQLSKANANSDVKLNLFVNLGGGCVLEYEKIILEAFDAMDMNNKFNVYWLDSNKASGLNFENYSKRYIEKIPYVNNMAKFLLDMDVAIGSCGVNAIERCAMGIPSLVFKTVENQSRNYQNLIKKRLVIPVLNKLDIAIKLDELYRSPQVLERESDYCRSKIDGKGVYRVADKIEFILN